MAGKISEYANAVATFADGDLVDVSKRLSTSPDVFESQKLEFAQFQAFIQANASNILNTNGLTLGGMYSHNLNSNYLTFTNGTLNISQGSLLVQAETNLGSTTVLFSKLNGDPMWTFLDDGNINLGSSPVATLTDTLRFKNGIVEIEGIGTAGSSALAIYDNDTTPNKLWDFLDNGNVNLGGDSSINLGSSALTFEGNTVGGVTFLSSGRSAFKGGNTSGSQICLEAQDGTGSRVFEVRNNGDIHIGASSPTVFLNTDLTIDVPNDLTVDYTGAGNLVTFENSSAAGSKSFVSYGRTVLKGVATSASQIAMQVDDSTDTRVFEVRCNGDIYTNGTQGFTGTGAYTNFTIENGIITNAS